MTAFETVRLLWGLSKILAQTANSNDGPGLSTLDGRRHKQKIRKGRHAASRSQHSHVVLLSLMRCSPTCCIFRSQGGSIHLWHCKGAQSGFPQMRMMTDTLSDTLLTTGHLAQDHTQPTRKLSLPRGMAGSFGCMTVAAFSSRMLSRYQRQIRTVPLAPPPPPGPCVSLRITTSATTPPRMEPVESQELTGGKKAIPRWQTFFGPRALKVFYNSGSRMLHA